MQYLIFVTCVSKLYTQHNFVITFIIIFKKMQRIKCWFISIKTRLEQQWETWFLRVPWKQQTPVAYIHRTNDLSILVSFFLLLMFTFKSPLRSSISTCLNIFGCASFYFFSVFWGRSHLVHLGQGLYFLMQLPNALSCIFSFHLACLG